MTELAPTHAAAAERVAFGDLGRDADVALRRRRRPFVVDEPLDSTASGLRTASSALCRVVAAGPGDLRLDGTVLPATVCTATTASTRRCRTARRCARGVGVSSRQLPCPLRGVKIYRDVRARRAQRGARAQARYPRRDAEPRESDLPTPSPRTLAPVNSVKRPSLR